MRPTFRAISARERNPRRGPLGSCGVRADTRPTRLPYPVSRLRRAVPSVAVLVAVAALAGCAAAGSTIPTGAAGPEVTRGPAAALRTPQRPERPTSRALPRRLPGLGARTLARIPDNAGQVLVVTGSGRNASSAKAVLETHTPDGWLAGTPWPARNAREGWTKVHHADDLRTPIGVFTLTDAGGRRPDPGTRLPYHRSDDFTATGTGFNGESLAGSFDYVVAINYNRALGTSPLDWTRPLGDDRGGGIWLHVDHDGPTHGCIALSEDHMKELMRLLDPRLHPVVVMGDATSLAR